MSFTESSTPLSFAQTGTTLSRNPPARASLSPLLLRKPTPRAPLSIREGIDAEIEAEEDAIERLRALSSAAKASLGWMSTSPRTRPTPAVLLRERQILDIELDLLRLEIARRARAMAKQQATRELAERDE